MESDIGLTPCRRCPQDQPCHAGKVKRQSKAKDAAFGSSTGGLHPMQELPKAALLISIRGRQVAGTCLWRWRDPELQHVPGLERDVLRGRRQHARMAARCLAGQQFQAQETCPAAD
jgi:hypothetical protein